MQHEGVIGKERLTITFVDFLTDMTKLALKVCIDKNAR